MDAVVEGSVLRSGEKVRITAQLIDARADKHLWARSFERSSRDVLALQADLASAIAREINVQVTPSEHTRLSGVRNVNPDAYDAYLRGRYFFNRPSDDNLKKAIEQYEAAVASSPDFAPGVFGAVGRVSLGRVQRGIHDGGRGEAKSHDGGGESRRSRPRFRRGRTRRWPPSSSSTSATGPAASGTSGSPSRSIPTTRSRTTSSAWRWPFRAVRRGRRRGQTRRGAGPALSPDPDRRRHGAAVPGRLPGSETSGPKGGGARPGVLLSRR